MGVSSPPRANVADCRNCGKSLLWLPAVLRRPLEAQPVPAVDPRDVGFVLRREGGRLVLFPSAWLPDPPAEHLRIHRCQEWRHRVPSLGEVLRGLAR